MVQEAEGSSAPGTVSVTQILPGPCQSVLRDDPEALGASDELPGTLHDSLCHRGSSTDE